MNRNLILLILLAVIILLFVMDCHSKNHTKNDSDTSEAIKRVDTLMTGSSEDDFSQQDIQVAIDILKNEILPMVSGNDKDELNKNIKYLNDTKEKLPDYLEDDDNKIEFYTTLMNLNLLLARNSPNDFDVNLKVATTYILIAASVDSSFSSEKIKHFSDDFNKKGIQAAKALVENFPDNPMSYGQLAHTTLVTGGDEKDVIRLLKKCLEIDEGTKYCKDFLGSITNE